MSGVLWVPGATKLTPSYDGGSSDYPSTAPRAVAHTVEAPAGGRPGSPDYWFWQMVSVLRGKSAEPQLLYDPLTDKLGQFFALNRTGRALQNDGSRRTNRVGEVCIQIEFMGYASRPFTRGWKPGPNFQAMMRAIGSWGVPDLWPSGKPPAYPGGHDERSRDIWYSRAGWYGHSQVPANSHGDPGEIDDNGEFFAAEKTTARYWPAWLKKYPGKTELGDGLGSDAPVNLLVKAALIAHEGPTGFRGEVTAAWDSAAAEKLEDFKKSQKLEAEDGLSLKVWNALGKMPSDAPDFPGDKAFVIGERSPNSLVGQALLALQGFGGVMHGSLSREWKPDAVRALRRFQLSEPRLSGDADGDWGPTTWLLAWTDSD